MDIIGCFQVLASFHIMDYSFLIGVHRIDQSESPSVSDDEKTFQSYYIYFFSFLNSDSSNSSRYVDWVNSHVIELTSFFLRSIFSETETNDILNADG